VVLPVVHVESIGQARRNVGVARAAGADGVFLTNHAIDPDTLLVIHDAIAADTPGFWTGVNCLGLSAERTLTAISEHVGGVWVDDAGIEENEVDQPYAEHLGGLKRRHAGTVCILAASHSNTSGTSTISRPPVKRRSHSSMSSQRAGPRPGLLLTSKRFGG